MKDENIAAFLGVFLFRLIEEKESFKNITGNELKLLIYLLYNVQHYQREKQPLVNEFFKKI